MATTGPEQIAEKLLPLAEVIAGLRPDPRNARKHGDKNLAAVRSSLTRFGQVKPIVVDADGIVLAGNGTLEAAKALGWKRLAVVRVPLTGADARAYALADNRTAELAEWDWEELASQTRELGADLLGALGWDQGDIEGLLAVDPSAGARSLLADSAPTPAGAPQAAPPLTLQSQAPRVEVVEDELPEPPAEAVSCLGEVYELGPHRLVCGDCTDPSVIASLMGDERADCAWTDPPYGVSYAAKNEFLTKFDRGSQQTSEIANDSLSPADLQALLKRAFASMLSVSKPGAAWYVAAPSGDIFLAFAQELAAIGVWRHTLAWVKNCMVLGRADYHYKHESVFYGWVPGGTHKWRSDRSQTSVLLFDRPVRSIDHPTMKPVALVAYCVGNNTDPGDIVLDVFGGSGTTLLACAQLGRVARLVELNPVYCDVIRRRWTAWARQAGVPVGSGALD